MKNAVAEIKLKFILKKIFIYPIVLLLACIYLVLGSTPHLLPKHTLWKLNNPAKVGGFTPEISGAPAIIRDKAGAGIAFNGIDDGLILPVNPVAGWPAFTIEVLVNPAADGPEAPRFIHFEDPDGKRGTLEMRITHERNWYLDTYLKNGASDKGLTLINAANLHPCNTWYWIALVYDGKKMIQYVNATKELEGNITFGPMGKGRIALGVRLNKVNWFKGQMRQISFYAAALNNTTLQR